MKKIKLILLFLKRLFFLIWELPQNLVGFILFLFMNPEKFDVIDGTVFMYSPQMRGGISLGSFIILSEADYRNGDEDSEKHEHGHKLQSMVLGWLYLIVVGLPSIVWATLYGWIIKETPNGYYRFYTERWADKWGKVVRK